MLTAVAYERNGREVGQDSLTSAGGELRLRVEPDTEGLMADGADLLYVPIELTDDAGIVCPLADREVTIEVTGAGTLIGFGSGQPITAEGFSSTRHSTFRGRALAVIRAGHQPGDVMITVSANGCEPVTVSIPVTAGELS